MVDRPKYLLIVNIQMALSALALSVLVYDRWRRSPHEVTTTNQKFSEAFLSGLKAVANAPSFHAILINTGVILFCTSAFMSMLPLVVKNILHLDSGIYGMLMGCLGIGAVLVAFLLPTLRAKFETHALLSYAAILFGILLCSLAMIKDIRALIILISLGGVAWVTLISTLIVAAIILFLSPLLAVKWKVEINLNK